MHVALLLMILSAGDTISWKTAGAGIEVAEIAAPTKSSHADSIFTVARVDPKARKLRLLMESEVGGGESEVDPVTLPPGQRISISPWSPTPACLRRTVMARVQPSS